MTTTTVAGSEVAVERLAVSAYTVPTDQLESDGTLEWDSTTCVVVEAEAGGERGLGYTYGDVSIATMVESKLTSVVEGTNALSPPAAWSKMQRAIRNAGRPGVGAMAISAVDVALWDLKARLLGVPLAALLPRFHDRVPIYGSGGFCSYSNERLQEQMQTWVEMDIPRLKIKVAREPEGDPERIRAVREVIGDRELFVDANGAYQRKQALEWAHRFHDDFGISYLEEPLTSEDLAGLRLLRDHGPPGLSIAAGEYSWNLLYSNGLLEAGCVDILQADVTRVGGITEMLRVDGLAKARSLPFSAHCAPAISAHVCCAMETAMHIEYFHDHVRVEKLLFEGTLEPAGGYLEPDRSSPGLGLELRRQDAEGYLVHYSKGKAER